MRLLKYCFGHLQFRDIWRRNVVEYLAEYGHKVRIYIVRLFFQQTEYCTNSNLIGRSKLNAREQSY